MKKTSIASLQERFSDWLSWDQAKYQLGACLGFWPEFGAPNDASGQMDPWHSTKNTIYEDNALGNILENFLYDLCEEGCLQDGGRMFRWNPEYKGMADVMSTL